MPLHISQQISILFLYVIHDFKHASHAILHVLHLSSKSSSSRNNQILHYFVHFGHSRKSMLSKRSHLEPEGHQTHVLFARMLHLTYILTRALPRTIFPFSNPLWTISSWIILPLWMDRIVPHALNVEENVTASGEMPSLLILSKESSASWPRPSLVYPAISEFQETTSRIGRCSRTSRAFRSIWHVAYMSTSKLPNMTFFSNKTLVTI